MKTPFDRFFHKGNGRHEPPFFTEKEKDYYGKKV